MGRDVDDKINHQAGGGINHLSAAFEEVRQARQQQYRIHPESAPIQIPIPSIEQVRDAANSAWINRLEPAYKTFNDIRERPEAESKSPWKSVDMDACNKAYEAFPSLSAHNIPHSLIPALIGNELRHYKPGFDSYEDMSVKLTGTFRDQHGIEKLDISVGPAQMQLINIKRLAENYSQLYAFKDNPAKEALDPAKAPYFVAAYLDEAIEKLEQKGIVPTVDALAYMYNPDLKGKKNADGKEIGPYIQQSRIDSLLTSDHFKNLPVMKYPNSEILSKSKHVKNVRDAMQIVEHSN